MIKFIRFGLASSLLLASSSYALNPIQGFYLGILGEISRGPADEQIAFIEDGKLFTGTVGYGVVGGGGAALLGYRLSHFRVEGEILYNRISTGPLKVGTCTLQSPNVPTPTGTCPAGSYDDFIGKGLGFNGSSNGLYGLVNFYYDFYSTDGDSDVVPYVGFGIGWAQIKNSTNFIYTKSLYSQGNSEVGTGGAAQGILGVSYYMDDYAWLGMDYRYTTTSSLPEIMNTRYTLNSLNFNVNFAFDKGGFD